MVLLSKEIYYNVPADLRTCKNLHVWYTSCLASNLFFFPRAALGTTKFLIPIYLVRLALNSNKIDKKYLKSFLISFGRSIIYGTLQGSLVLVTNCIISNTVGCVDYYCLGFLPGFVAGLSILATDYDNRVINTIGTFNLVIEALFNNLSYFNVVKFTRIGETLLFSLISSLLMYLLQNRTEKIKFRHFWLYTPPMRKSETDEEKCYHSEKCSKYWIDGIRKYSALGYLFGILKRLLPKMAILFKNPKEVFTILFHTSNVKLGLFFGTYVALYRYISCNLLKKDKSQKSLHAALAGFLSGITYMIEPNIQILSIALTTTLQVLYDRSKNYLNITNSLIPLQLLYMLCNGLLFHNRTMSPETCPKFYMNLTRIGSSNLTEEAYAQIVKLFF